jgi:hypothetical protein
VKIIARSKDLGCEFVAVSAAPLFAIKKVSNEIAFFARAEMLENERQLIKDVALEMRLVQSRRCERGNEFNPLLRGGALKRLRELRKRHTRFQDEGGIPERTEANQLFAGVFIEGANLLQRI